MVHILPHWNWTDRIGQVTPVHVFTSGDEVELFLNGTSLGRKKKGEYEYRLRWADVVYEPGELKAVAYKNGAVWKEETIKTTGKPTKLVATADRTKIASRGNDLSFIHVKLVDENGLFVANANNTITFSVEGPAEIIATDNGDPTDMTAFNSKTRKAFNGLVLGIVKPNQGASGVIKVSVESSGLETAIIELTSE